MGEPAAEGASVTDAVKGGRAGASEAGGLGDELGLSTRRGLEERSLSAVTKGKCKSRSRTAKVDSRRSLRMPNARAAGRKARLSRAIARLEQKLAMSA